MTVTEFDDQIASRRRLLKAAAAVGTAAWVTPFIASSPAHAVCPATPKCVPSNLSPSPVSLAAQLCGTPEPDGINFALTLSAPACPCVTPATVLSGTGGPLFTVSGSGTATLLTPQTLTSAPFNLRVDSTPTSATFTGTMARTVTCRDISGDTITRTLTITINAVIARDGNVKCGRHSVTSATASASYEAGNGCV